MLVGCTLDPWLGLCWMFIGFLFDVRWMFVGFLVGFVLDFHWTFAGFSLGFRLGCILFNRSAHSARPSHRQWKWGMGRGKWEVGGGEWDIYQQSNENVDASII